MRHIPCCSCHRHSFPFLYSRVILRPLRAAWTLLQKYLKIVVYENASLAALSRRTESRNERISARFLLRMNERGDVKPDSHPDQGFSVGVASSCNLDARELWGFLKKYLEHLHRYISPVADPSPDSWSYNHDKHSETYDMFALENVNAISSLTKLANFIQSN